MRRKAGQLVPLEIAICDAAARLRRRGVNEFHGYEIAKRIGEDVDSKLLTAYGTLYRALGRLESMGLLESRWEDPQIAANENRPGRRLYSLTGAAEETLAVQRKVAAAKAPKRVRRRLVPA
jgi:PadR family transcriptional regulator, regulatory protein PadR